MMSPLILSILHAMLPFLATIAGYAGTQLAAYLRAHAHGALANTALDVLENIVTTVVTNLEQTIAADARAKSVDGKLTTADALSLKVKALETLKSYYGAEGLALLAKSLKMSEDSALKLIGDKIEVAVYNLKFPNQAALPVFRAGPVVTN